jgi:hypothetical protein
VVSTRRANAGIVWVSTPGDYATLNSNHTPDGTSTGVREAVDSVRAYFMTFFRIQTFPNLAGYLPT